MSKQTGALFKFKPQFHQWESAMLQSVGRNERGFYLKVDGEPKGGGTEQLYLYLSEEDVDQIIETWSLKREPDLKGVCERCLAR